MKKVILFAAACCTLALGASAQTDSTSFGDDTDVMESTTPQASDRGTYDDSGYPTSDTSSLSDPYSNPEEGMDAMEPDYSAPDATESDYSTPDATTTTPDASEFDDYDASEAPAEDPMMEPETMPEPDPNSPN